jgi:hypothetical protein
MSPLVRALAYVIAILFVRPAAVRVSLEVSPKN